MKVKIICTFCKKEVEICSSEQKRGGGKFCSKQCSGKYHSSLPRKNDDKTNHNVQCAACETSFYKSKSRLKTSKSGLYFCSRKCKDSSQKIGGIKEIMPAHFGTGKIDYRKIAFEKNEQVCKRCGYDKYPIMVVHHKDRNRENSHPDNLEVLCSRCHDEEHFLAKDGRWGSNKKKF